MLPVSMHPLEALSMKDMPAHQTCDSLTVFERARANGVSVVVAIVVQRCGEVEVVGVRGVAEVRQGVKLDVTS